MAFKKITATKAILAQACLWLALMGASWHAAAAQLVGTVMQLSGPMMAKKADGKIKVLAIKSDVEEGDTLVTEKSTYALVKFIDNSEMTLKPGTTFVIEKFAYQAEQAAGDQASFNLVKGGLRSISGLLGKRSREKFSLKTPTATIGIRGTTFIVEFVQAALSGVPAPFDPRPPGTYSYVLSGGIVMRNTGGPVIVVPGEGAYAPIDGKDIIKLPDTSGTQFSPPPVFDNTGTNGNPPPAGASAADSRRDTVDCVVR